MPTSWLSTYDTARAQPPTRAETPLFLNAVLVSPNSRSTSARIAGFAPRLRGCGGRIQNQHVDLRKRPTKRPTRPDRRARTPRRRHPATGAAEDQPIPVRPAGHRRPKGRWRRSPRWSMCPADGGHAEGALGRGGRPRHGDDPIVAVGVDHENDAARLTRHRSGHHVPVPEDSRLDRVDQDLDRGVVEEVEDERNLVLDGVGVGTTEETLHPLAEEGEVNRHAAGPDHASGNKAISLNRLSKALDLRRQATAEQEEQAVQGGCRRRRLGPS